MNLNTYLELLSNQNIYLDKFDEKFLKTIKDFDNIIYDPNKFDGKYYTIIYNDNKAGVIGVIKLGNLNLLQIAIHQNFRGKDLLKKSVTLLAEKLNIKRIYATIYLDNIASYKAHIKAGFKEISKKEKEELIKSRKLKEGATRLYKDF